MKPFLKGIFVVLFFACSEDSDFRVYEEFTVENSQEKFGYQTYENFIIPHSRIQNIAFGKFGLLNDSLIYYGIEKDSLWVQIYFLQTGKIHNVNTFRGFSLSPHFSISISDSFIVLSNGYEFGILVYNLKGKLIISNMREKIVLPSKQLAVIAHFDLYNDTHLESDGKFVFRLSGYNVSTSGKPFYESPAYILLDSLNQRQNFNLLFYYPKEYLSSTNYHQRDFALSSVLNGDYELLISIPRDHFLYLTGNGKRQKFLAKSEFTQGFSSIPRKASLVERKNVIMNDNYYTFFIQNRNKNEYYRFFKHKTISDYEMTKSETGSWSVLLIDSTYNTFGEVLFPGGSGYIMQNAFPYRQGIILQNLNFTDDQAHFDYIAFYPIGRSDISGLPPHTK
jgi:hypothetical protein